MRGRIQTVVLPIIAVFWIVGCGQSVTPRSHTTVIKSLSPSFKFPDAAQNWLVDLSFINPNQGWLLTNPSNTKLILFHSDDGGMTWNQEAQLLVARNMGVRSTPIPVDQNHLFIESGNSLWFVSKNGAKISNRTLPFTYLVVDYTFLNSKEGWALGQDGMGASSEPTWLYATTDGGVHWKLISSADSFYPTPSGELPTGLSKSIPVFANRNQGWIVLSGAQDSIAKLYETTDAGAKWYQQSVPLPTGVNSSWPVHMATPITDPYKDSMLLLADYTSPTYKEHEFAIYQSKINSTTWHLMTSWVSEESFFSPFQSIFWGFTSPNFGYVEYGTNLWTSIDGGNKWRRSAIPLPSNVKWIMGFAFQSQPLMGTNHFAVVCHPDPERGAGESFFLTTIRYIMEFG